MFAFNDTLIETGAVIAAHTPDDVPAALTQLQAALDDGFYAGGFFAYELGYILDPRLAPLLPPDRKLPLLWFTLSKNPKPFATEPGPYSLGPMQIMDRADYIKKCAHVIGNIHAGEIYQANLTFRARFPFTGSPRALFADLLEKQPTPYAAYIETPAFTIASLSPELFFHLEHGKITTKPMKGTAPRASPIDDLRNDPKQRAENLMIVDLMRNDLGRIGKNIRVDDMFAVETHPTLHQMTSTISADTNANLRELLTGLFPAGSITGAPKIRAMEIIRTLEDTPRGVYCGAIGLLHRDRMIMNVAIRTITIMNNTAEIGIGSGVVVDSVPNAEYDECLLKMKFLQPAFALIETFRKDGAYDYYPEHIARLQNSCAHFNFPLDLPAIERNLQNQPDGMVRLVVQSDGTHTITSKPLRPTPSMRAILSGQTLDSSNPYLPHKTTLRDFYEKSAAAHPGYDEVIFLNERGELCEGTRTNIFIESPGGILLTPALSCGLLPGTLRARLLATGQAKEAVLYPAELAKGAVFLGNGVRGMVPATVVIS